MLASRRCAFGGCAARRARVQSAAFAATGAWLAVSESRTIRAAVAAATRVLALAHVPEPAPSAQHLAVHCFGGVRTRAHALVSARKPRAHELHRFVRLCAQRERRRTPVQYLVGDWQFRELTLLVRRPVLIPRPETEELVELVLRDVRASDARVVDVGCGSGAILLALLAARARWSAVGVDPAREAVRLSNLNVGRLRMQRRATIVHGTLRDVGARGGMFDALVSNPPYVRASEMEALPTEVRAHEDFGALCGGEDGLDVVREVLRWAPSVVKTGGSVWLEVDASHPAMLERMRFERVQYVRTHVDLSGNARFCQLRVL